ncbi:hypothetical protein MMC25_003168 [Agyrium rufum]|nr:hypothetical protein [Agyrium rufum]
MPNRRDSFASTITPASSDSQPDVSNAEEELVESEEPQLLPSWLPGESEHKVLARRMKDEGRVAGRPCVQYTGNEVVCYELEGCRLCAYCTAKKYATLACNRTQDRRDENEGSESTETLPRTRHQAKQSKKKSNTSFTNSYENPSSLRAVEANGATTKVPEPTQPNP